MIAEDYSVFLTTEHYEHTPKSARYILDVNGAFSSNQKAPIYSRTDDQVL